MANTPAPLPNEYNWLMRQSGLWKEDCLGHRWPKILSPHEEERPSPTYWWYLMVDDWLWERVKSDIFRVLQGFFPNFTHFTDEAVKARMRRAAHPDFGVPPGAEMRRFLVLINPERPSVHLQIRDIYCPLYLVEVGGSIIEGTELATDKRINFLLLTRLHAPGRFGRFRRGTFGHEVNFNGAGGTILPANETKAPLPQGTLLSEMAEKPPPRRRERLVIPPRRDAVPPIKYQPPTPPRFPVMVTPITPSHLPPTGSQQQGGDGAIEKENDTTRTATDRVEMALEVLLMLVLIVMVGMCFWSVFHMFEL